MGGEGGQGRESASRLPLRRTREADIASAHGPATTMNWRER